MAKKRSDLFLTDEQVEAEIARLTESEAVALARYEENLKYRRRRYMSFLRSMEQRGKALIAAGETRESLAAKYKNDLEEEE